MQFGSMDVGLLHSGHLHVSATHVAIFRVVITRIQIELKCALISPQFKNHTVLVKIRGLIIKYRRV